MRTPQHPERETAGQAKNPRFAVDSIVGLKYRDPREQSKHLRFSEEVTQNLHDATFRRVARDALVWLPLTDRPASNLRSAVMYMSGSNYITQPNKASQRTHALTRAL